MNGHTKTCRCFPCSTSRKNVENFRKTVIEYVKKMTKPEDYSWASGLRNIGAK